MIIARLYEAVNGVCCPLFLIRERLKAWSACWLYLNQGSLKRFSISLRNFSTSEDKMGFPPVSLEPVLES
jgi:hypothetical protein